MSGKLQFWAFSQSYSRVGLAFCMYSWAICKGLKLLPVKVCTENWPWCRGGGKAHGTLGVLWTSWGVCRWAVPSCLWRGFLLKSTKQLIRFMAFWWVPSSDCCAPNLSQPIRDANHFIILGQVRKKWTSYIVSHTAREVRQSLTLF